MPWRTFGDTELKDHVAADLAIFDGQAAARVDAGKRELSCGYFCDREPAKPGSIWTDADGRQFPYDFIQRNIRGNHVAIVDCGRAGPDARIKLDVGDAVQVPPRSGVHTTETPSGERKTQMEKITIDGVTYEVSTQAQQAIAKMTAAHTAKVATLTADLDKATARADGAQAQIEKLTADLKTAQDPQTINAAVQARVSLEATAKALGVTVDGQSNDQIHRAVINKLSPGINLDGKSDDYTIALFEGLTEKSILSKLANTTSVKADAIPGSDNTKPNPRAAYNAEFFKPLASK